MRLKPHLLFIAISMLSLSVLGRETCRGLFVPERGIQQPPGYKYDLVVKVESRDKRQCSQSCTLQGVINKIQHETGTHYSADYILSLEMFKKSYEMIHDADSVSPTGIKDRLVKRHSLSESMQMIHRYGLMKEADFRWSAELIEELRPVVPRYLRYQAQTLPKQKSERYIKQQKKLFDLDLNESTLMPDYIVYSEVLMFRIYEIISSMALEHQAATSTEIQSVLKQRAIFKINELEEMFNRSVPQTHKGIAKLNYQEVTSQVPLNRVFYIRSNNTKNTENFPVKRVYNKSFIRRAEQNMGFEQVISYIVRQLEMNKTTLVQYQNYEDLIHNQLRYSVQFTPDASKDYTPSSNSLHTAIVRGVKFDKSGKPQWLLLQDSKGFGETHVHVNYLREMLMSAAEFQ